MTAVWRNWAGDQVCAPARVERPHDEAELCAAVARAADDGRRVRAVGSGHSFTDAACTDGVMVSLDEMSRIVDVDRASGLVQVQAGIKLHHLGDELARHGLAMENLGDIAVQSLAGAISTATHGTGLNYPNLSMQVRGLRLVTAGGEVMDLREGDDLKAARVAIGSLGVISTVTLQTVPVYTLKRVDEPLPLGETLATMEERIRANEHWEFFTFPYTGVAFTRATNRTGEAPEPPSRAERIVKDVVAENAVLGAICNAARIAPRATPHLNRLLPKLVTKEVRTDRSDRVFANQRLVRFTEMEYAIPREHGAEAVRAILELIERRRLPITFPLEVRFAPPDDAPLGPSHGRESCYIAVHVYRGTAFESYFRGVEQIMSAYDGRPHWGKRHYLTSDQLEDRYPEWNAFQDVRARLDPDGVFANDYTRRVLGDVRVRARSA